ncbi:hypothetical protein [Streptomyces decoyicus]|uniref:hypothetical protein n=1 Tax=Streptomyces decoyicus TaxID=249567 RepID=UPI0033B08DED
MPETGPTQLQIFPDDAVTGSGKPTSDWPITAPTLTPALASAVTSRPRAEQLSLDGDEMRSAAA